MAEAQSRPSRRMGKSTSPRPANKTRQGPEKSQRPRHPRPPGASRSPASERVVTATESLTAAATHQITLASAAAAGTTGHAMARPDPGAPTPAAP
jgi:hypothetical protein